MVRWEPIPIQMWISVRLQGLGKELDMGRRKDMRVEGGAWSGEGDG